MKLLAIDTSTEVCSLCISDTGRIVAEYVSRSGITHTERLLPAIDFLFSHIDWKLEELDGLAVTNGPGSFTGLRISLSVVKGLSYALNLPVIACSSLEVAANQAGFDGWICPAMDARRGQIFTCLYERKSGQLVLRLEPVSVDPQTWRQKLPPEPVYFCGPGAALYFNELTNHERSTLLYEDFILARTLARLGEMKFQRGEVISGGELRAAYLRPSDAELKGPRPSKKIAK